MEQKRHIKNNHISDLSNNEVSDDNFSVININNNTKN